MTSPIDYSNALAAPGPEPVTEATFFDQTTQLRKILAWARVRRVAPWALILAVLVRVSARIPPDVRLRGLIGGQASLNVFAAFVSGSGGGKGASDRVSRLAYPADIAIRIPSSGEGIAELFTLRGKESEDNERLRSVILSVGEIDALTGQADRRGSVLLATLKSAWMGEPLGQANATKALSRYVAEHDYRLCMSVGVQFGHGAVLLGDASGGTPQRFVWIPTQDPSMPRGGGPDPEPLDTALPLWEHDSNGVCEIEYGIPEIETLVIDSHLARQRGEGDALDGHSLLSRCKIAAIIAALHQRRIVTQLDWELSGVVMQVSDRTRQSLIDYDRQAARAKLRERAISRVTFDEVIDERHGTTVRNRILRLLANGPMARGELRRAMGKQHYREAFDAVLPHLEKVSQVVVIEGEKAPHYALNPEFTGEPEFTPGNSRSSGVNHKFTGEPGATVTDLDTRRSSEMGRPKSPARQWFDDHIAGLLEAGHDTADSFAVYSAGEAEGHSRQQLRSAANNHPAVTVIDRSGGTSTWDITGTRQGPYQSADAWVADYLKAIPPDTDVDKTAFRHAAETAGHSWSAARHAATESGLIDTGHRRGKQTVWITRGSESGTAS